MNRLLPALLIATLATPSLAGGPIVLEEAEEVAAEAAGSGNILIPLLAVVIIAVALSGGDSNGKDACAYAAVDC